MLKLQDPGFGTRRYSDDAYNYSHDNWSAILAHIGKPEELDTSARNAGALTRRREIR
ncbi:hypothetical protein NQ074_24355, partial [Escherichia coli]|nr:hypothetical protein [Escherichia coli]